MEKDLLGQSLNFISENILDITLVVLIIFLTISYMLLNGITIEETKPELKKVVVFENMESGNEVKSTSSNLEVALKKGFCEQTNSMDDPDQNCNKLDKTTCSKYVKCCLYDIKGNKCVSATSGRPTNLSSSIDEWYYLGELKKK